MDTKLATTQIRMQNWAAVIKERNASGLTINDYCKQKGISRNAYCYWLRRVRSEVLADSGFVEVPKPEIVQEAGFSGRCMVYHLRQNRRRP